MSINEIQKDIYVCIELFKSIRDYKKSSFLAVLFISIESIIECSIPFFMAYFVDQVLRSEFNYALIITLIILPLLALMFGFLGDSLCAKAACGYAKNLRRDIFSKIQEFSFEDIDKFTTESLVTRITTDVINIQNAYILVLSTAVRGLIVLACSFLMSYIMGGFVIIFFVLFSPILGFGLLYIARRAMPLVRALLKKYDELNTCLRENIRNIKLVKSFVREEFERSKFTMSSDNLYRDFLYSDRLFAMISPLMNFFIHLTMLFILYYGTYVSVTSFRSDLNIGQISSLLTYGVYILESFTFLSMLFVKIIMARTSALRIAEVLTSESSIVSPSNGKKRVKDGSIDFEGVTFIYAGRTQASLEGIDLHISSGETIGIIGSTGSGKSTLVQLIPRLYDATEGKIYVGGTEVSNYDLNALRKSAVIVLQNDKIFSGTIRENLTWGRKEATEKDLDRVCHIACIDEFIHSLPLGYDTLISQDGVNLSGGQRQRIYIARALLKSPQVLILDDTTSAIDSHTENKIRAELRKVLPETTKIIISQRVRSIQESDRIIVIEKGRIEAIGSHEYLLKASKIYSQLYMSQQQLKF